jgi:mevalonyl-CoA ligase
MVSVRFHSHTRYTAAGVLIRQIGMTELSCIVFLTTPTEVSLLDNHTSVGTVMPHTAARVVDENLVTVPPGEPGELLVSGYLTFHGYYKNPKSTASTFVRDSRGKLWLRTGDLVTIDADGRCVILGRTKDMIKRGVHLMPFSPSLFSWLMQ